MNDSVHIHRGTHMKEMNDMNSDNNQNTAPVNPVVNKADIERHCDSGRWLKGISGNPSGRPKGALNKDSNARELVFAQAGEIVRKSLKEALSGNQTLLSQLLGIVVAPAKSQLGAVEIPGAADAMASGNYDQALALITRAALNGDVSPDIAKTLTDQISAAGEARRISSLQDQINMLREKVVSGRVVDSSLRKAIDG